jgi:hypothetical protein
MANPFADISMNLRIVGTNLLKIMGKRFEISNGVYKQLIVLGNICADGSTEE